MPSLTNLTREHVAAWMDWMRSAANKPATIHTRYRGASAFYKWLIMEADDAAACRTDSVQRRGDKQNRYDAAASRADPDGRAARLD